jgi:abequosyltransferase
MGNNKIKRPFFTIAIPTYNRALYLDKCLSQICKQLNEKDSLVEVLISNNNSSDGTEEVVSRYISIYPNIQYVKNRENIGPDKNFVQCFNMSRGKYVLLFGDDDILLDGAIERILEILLDDEYGIVYLNSYLFENDYHKGRAKKYARGYIVYNDIEKFIKRVHYYFAFISGNIFNKSLVDKDVDCEEFLNTNLVQLCWTFSALFNSQKNAYVQECLFATQLSESREYKLSEVFGNNFKKIGDIFTRRGINRRYFKIIEKKILISYLPAHIIRSRKGIIDLKSENYFSAFYPNYHNNLYFWIFIVPAIFLPRSIAYFLFSVVKKSRDIVFAIKSQITGINFRPDQKGSLDTRITKNICNELSPKESNEKYGPRKI